VRRMGGVLPSQREIVAGVRAALASRGSRGGGGGERGEEARA
jgi:hypothetical protein